MRPPRGASRSTFWTRRKRPNRSTGRPKTNPDVPVARIAGVFGLSGELKCDPTGAGRPLIVAGARLRCERSGTLADVALTGVRPHKGRLLVRIEGVGDAGAAHAYAGAMLYAPRAEIQLAPGEYLDADLVGCRVVGRDGREFGRVGAVEHYPASDMLVVDGTLVPMVGAIVVAIDLGKSEIAIDPPAGLFP